MSGTARRVTLADVAASAGVSRATASRALAGDSRITEPTRLAVKRAAGALRYVPNAAARSLRVRRTRTLGLLVPDFSDPVHGQVASGFEQEASAQGYSVIFVAGLGLPSNERRALKLFLEHSTDGIAIVSSVIDPSEARRRVGPERLVVVQPDHLGLLSRQRGLPAGLIRTDDAAGIEAAVDHLLARGHRQIAYLGAGARPSDVLRRETADRCLRQRGGGPLRDIRVEIDGWRHPEEIGRAVAADRPDAVICYDDKLALALLDGLSMCGLRVPDDIAVVGFDGIPFAALSNPRLTTIATPTAEMGRLAARALIEAIATGTMPPARTLPAELVVRDSTTPSRLREARPQPAMPAHVG